MFLFLVHVLVLVSPLCTLTFSRAYACACISEPGFSDSLLSLFSLNYLCLFSLQSSSIFPFIMRYNRLYSCYLFTLLSVLLSILKSLSVPTQAVTAYVLSQFTTCNSYRQYTPYRCYNVHFHSVRYFFLL